MTYLQLGQYVYCHMKPTDGSIFYIGKGTGNRAFISGRRNAHWKNTVAKHGGFIPKILAAGLTHEEAYNFERRIVVGLRLQHGVKLANLTDGGDGGFNPSTETREKMRDKKLGRKLTEEHKNKIAEANRRRAYTKGYKLNLTDESRIARAERTKNQIWTEDRKRKISEAKIGTPHSDETKIKISLAKKGKPWTEARKAAQQLRGQ